MTWLFIFRQDSCENERDEDDNLSADEEIALSCNLLSCVCEEINCDEMNSIDLPLTIRCANLACIFPFLLYNYYNGDIFLYNNNYYYHVVDFRIRFCLSPCKRSSGIGLFNCVVGFSTKNNIFVIFLRVFRMTLSILAGLGQFTSSRIVIFVIFILALVVHTSNIFTGEDGDYLLSKIMRA